MANSENNRYFHLNRIEKGELLLAQVPHWVNASRIDAIRRQSDSSLQIVATSKQIQRNAKEVIVDKAAEYCEEPHHKDHVAQFDQLL